MTTTHTGTPEGQVLVVGAGPTGLTLAAQLLARGIHVRVIDKGAGPASQSRALSIQARTLELLDTMGLADAFVGHGHRVRRLHWYASQRNLCDLDLARNGSRYGFVLDLPQSRTETLLRARVQELGGTIEQGVELARLAERGGAVDATLRDAAGRESEVSAGYVVGCDGAHSRVRHEIGLPFEGQPYPQDWLLADVALDGAGSDGAVHAFFRPNGLPLVCIPMGGQRWRLVMANAGDRGGQPPTFAEIQEQVAERAPWPIEVSDPQWLASFRCHLRSTSSYRRGRVLLAGDAAHIHSPAGGQGMNTGMMDAHNLAWKLALVADGRAPRHLWPGAHPCRVRRARVHQQARRTVDHAELGQAGRAGHRRSRREPHADGPARCGPPRCPSSRSPTRGARWSSPTATAAGRSPEIGSPTSTSVASTDRRGCITCSATDATC